MTDQKEHIISTFNNFNGKNLNALNSFYAPDVYFQDPVTTRNGLEDLKKYYAHAYKNVKSIRFDFAPISRDGEQYFAPWVMTLAAKGLNRGEEFTVKGLSHIRFNDKGLVSYHRDYLDLGELIYERLPIQGFIISKIKSLL